MFKIHQKIKNSIISGWKDTVKSELEITFNDHDLHAIAIPAPGKGILENVTESTIRSFILSKGIIPAWYYDSFQDWIGIIEPSDKIMGCIMFSNLHYSDDVYIILMPKILRYSSINRIVSELDGNICSGFFKIIRNVDRTYSLRMIPYRSAMKLRFIFLYDKKTEKKAKELERIVLNAYDFKGGI